MNRVITEQDIGTAETPDTGLNGSSTEGLVPDADVTQDPDVGANAPDGEGSADASPESFYSGNPEELPDEVYGHYKDMERGFQAKMRQQAEIRKDLQTELSAARQEREKLTHLGVQLQARLDAPTERKGPDGSFLRDEARDTGPSRDDLIAEVKQKVQAGQGVEALAYMVEKLTAQHASKSPAVAQFEEKIAALETRLADYEGPAKIQRQTASLNAAFEDLKSGEYPQLGNDKVVSRVRAAFEGNDPVIQGMISNGMHREAIAFATERALREVTENRTINQARRRRDSSPPRSEAGSAEKTAINSATMSFEDIVNAVLG